MWAAVLLYSATRSSYVAVCKSDHADKQPSRLDASDADGPPRRRGAVAHRVRCRASIEGGSGGRGIRRGEVRRVPRGSALVTHCGWPRHHGTPRPRRRWLMPSRASTSDSTASAARPTLDGMTYARVDVRHPEKADFVRVRTLVDTGSTDCELKADVIRKLGLPAGETAHFEAGRGPRHGAAHLRGRDPRARPRGARRAVAGRRRRVGRRVGTGSTRTRRAVWGSTGSRTNACSGIRHWRHSTWRWTAGKGGSWRCPVTSFIPWGL